MSAERREHNASPSSSARSGVCPQAQRTSVALIEVPRRGDTSCTAAPRRSKPRACRRLGRHRGHRGCQAHQEHQERRGLEARRLEGRPCRTVRQSQPPGGGWWECSQAGGPQRTHGAVPHRGRLDPRFPSRLYSARWQGQPRPRGARTHIRGRTRAATDRHQALPSYQERHSRLPNQSQRATP